ncbi:STAS domain-containing protein [Dactylosporangium sp. CA-092794]|uniref:STAS domain-containing protein n=1 Tax=Dactylosporangium sp. CA-092794 TaxID=3239929 RepID=UPI003D941A79
MDRPDLSGSVGLSVSVRRAATETVVSLSGEIDMSTVPRLAAAVDEVLSEPTPRVVLDMAGVTFCDSQGLGTLVVLSRKATLTQSYLVLVNVGAFLIRVLDITGLRNALMIQEA